MSHAVVIGDAMVKFAGAASGPIFMAPGEGFAPGCPPVLMLGDVVSAGVSPWLLVAGGILLLVALGRLRKST